MLRKVTVLVLAALAFPAVAQPKSEGGAAIVRRLAECGEAPDDAAQLACYRRAAEALVKAEAGGAIVVVDRADARKVRRQAFGLSMPSLSLFDMGEPEAELSTLVGQVRTARQDVSGRWIVQLADGGTWTQVDTVPLRRSPSAGMRVTIIRAALGSYKMSVGDQVAVRAKRVE
ncbi:MAG: hypothetical protein KKE02_11245 [Alphaproteobacteria bacterium]|nr:hypothetical protein [Alphaproteobacteria bacterium]MBU1512480.1 hypothetical protein [Alphaproteobacteria bacterium]MBU2096596.1 hypothetical protein [Alphaproteobacteria bacterium]MBU2151586.1 hypothetical protein [Alphaproteobacteria bacterium]MBU2307303.1 hypothetical protein [Alphaproteobacteria bacterium]